MIYSASFILVALGSGYNVDIVEPDVYPLAIQGPKSEDLLISIFGEDIKKLKFFNFKVFDFLGTKQIIARSGYSKQDGFEIYFKGFETHFNEIELGEKLGVLELAPEDLALASYVCPSKYDYQSILSSNLDKMYEEFQ